MTNFLLLLVIALLVVIGAELRAGKVDRKEGDDPATMVAICPHCRHPIENIFWRSFADGHVALVCDTRCGNVIGANAYTNPVVKKP